MLTGIKGKDEARTVVVDGVGQVVAQVLQGPLARDKCLGPEAQIRQHRQPPIPDLQQQQQEHTLETQHTRA